MWEGFKTADKDLSKVGANEVEGEGKFEDAEVEEEDNSLVRLGSKKGKTLAMSRGKMAKLLRLFPIKALHTPIR